MVRKEDVPLTMVNAKGAVSFNLEQPRLLKKWQRTSEKLGN